MDFSMPGFPVLHHLPEFAYNSCALSRWCYPDISFSVVLFYFCLQSFPASGFFPVNRLFTSDGQSTGASASESVLWMNIQSLFPLRLTHWISLLSKGLWRVFSNTTVQKHQFFGTQAFFIVQLLYSYITTGKTIALIIWTFVCKVMSLLFNMPSRFVIAFLPRSKCLLISLL